ncbi:hypothetical protein Q9L58_001081 [Maublancomyces gigas]|uniref:Uncharacterized protein n=1 Tax=Discina gigas TaxID=1032678 RepID=A0ABR3GV04_9PEZI
MLRFSPPTTLPATPATYGALSFGVVVLLVGWVRRRRSVSLPPTPAPAPVSALVLAPSAAPVPVPAPRKKQAPLGYHSPLCSSADIVSLEQFNYRETAPAKFRPFKPDHQHAMGRSPLLPSSSKVRFVPAPTVDPSLTRLLPSGVESCPASELILIDHLYPSRISLRKRLLQTQPTATLVHSSPASIPAITELYTFLLRTYLPIRFPSHFILSPSGTLFTNLITHDTHPIAPPPHTNPSDPAPALRILATSIEEDVMVLLPDQSGVYRLAAFACCFPSGYAPERKAGMSLDELHAPVPGYADKLSVSMNRFFSRLRPGLENAVRRYNWAITTHDRLFALHGNQHYDDEDEEDYEEEEEEDERVDPENCRLRVERQVLWKLPGTQAAVFMIKTYLYTLAEVKAEGLAEELARSIEGMGEDMGRYKRRGVWGEKVVEFLRS